MKNYVTVKQDNLPDESWWSRRSGWFSLAVIVIVSILGVVMDRLLLQEGLPRAGMLILSNSLTGLFAGWLFYQAAKAEKASRELVRARMKTIAELNHHIRNALQVIKYLGGAQRSGLDGMQLQLINDSVDRIEWALREVLPRYPLGKEGAANSDPNAVGPAA